MITTYTENQISTVDALWTLIKSQKKSVRRALFLRVLASDEAFLAKQQKKKVKDSLTRAFDELHSGQAKHDARNLFNY